MIDHRPFHVYLFAYSYQDISLTYCMIFDAIRPVLFPTDYFSPKIVRHDVYMPERRRNYYYAELVSFEFNNIHDATNFKMTFGGFDNYDDIIALYKKCSKYSDKYDMKYFLSFRKTIDVFHENYDSKEKHIMQTFGLRIDLDDKEKTNEMIKFIRENFDIKNISLCMTCFVSKKSLDVFFYEQSDFVLFKLKYGGENIFVPPPVYNIERISNIIEELNRG